MTRRSCATDLGEEGCGDPHFIRSSLVMKTALFLGSALGVLLLVGSASAAKIQYKATLNGEQETPKVTTQATGTATLEYDDQTKQLKGELTYTGLTATAIHIHKEVCGKAGDIVPNIDIGDDLSSPLPIDITLETA